MITASTATARWIEWWSVKTVAHATKTHASAQAKVVEAERCPSARATAAPGTSTATVPKTRRRYSIT